MKRSNLFRIIGASVLTLSTATVPTLPASAQVVEPGIEREGIYETEDDGFDWGWLGFSIGLFGLVAKAPRNLLIESLSQ